MKTSLRFVTFLAVAILGLAPPLSAQTFTDYGGVYGGGGPVYEPAAGGAVGMSDFQVRALPGRFWFGTNITDEGLGFQGTYATIGAKTRIGEDMLDGRWLSEVRIHHSLENDGGLFANIGIERVFSIDAAGADVSLSAWFDYDDDQQGNFSHTFIQWGVSGAIKTRRWDLMGNAYFPEGTTDYTQGDPNGVNCFLGHSIVITPGIDSALQGFDVTLRNRPSALAFMNAAIDVGGYGYRSDIVEFFGGGRARVSAQMLRGLIVAGEITYDDRFDVTGGINLSYVFGANNARGGEYSGLARDLERTVRQDHITRFNQSVVLAIDPDTGRPYNVYHVDNSADASVATGEAETPFTTLADAEAASSAHDIIFVREGRNNTVGYDTGIQLRDGQMLLGDGVQHLIPLADGTNFILCNDVDGLRPTITGQNNGAAVNLANDNVVRGFNIDGSVANGGMAYGIHGNGTGRGQPINGAVIEDNTITGAVLHGIYIQESIGDFTYARNATNDNGFDGILMELHCDPASTIRFEDNIANNNGRDGISLDQYDVESLEFLRNITNGNGRDGLRLVGFKNTLGNGLPLDIIGHTANNNNGNGIHINGGDGNLRLLNSTVNGNTGSGIMIVDWTNTDPLTQTLIGTTTGGTSSIIGNGRGAEAGIDILQTVAGATQRVLITNSQVDQNGIGIRSIAEGLGTQLFTNVVDNLSVSNNLSDGMRFISRGAATHTVLVEQTGVNPQLTMTGNGAVLGSGISLFAGDASGGQISLLDITLRNVNITGSGGDGIAGNIILDGTTNLLIENSTISGNGGSGIDLELNTNFNQVVNSVVTRNLIMNGNAGNGIDVTTFGGTFTDFVSVNNTLVGGGGDGINISANGNTTNAAIDNRTRVFVQGTQINGFALNGLDLIGNGDAHLLANIDGNTIINNGLAGGTLPFFHGVNVIANTDAQMNIRMTNNLVTANAERGLNMTTNGDGIINAVAIDNNFGGNDIGDDTAVAGDVGIDDITINNGVTGQICLAMSNNFISLLPPDINNAAAQVFFRLELDGLTNGFDLNDLAPNSFTGGAFGSVCDGLIAAEEAAFIADGFPLQ